MLPSWGFKKEMRKKDGMSEDMSKEIINGNSAITQIGLEHLGLPRVLFALLVHVAVPMLSLEFLKSERLD